MTSNGAKSSEDIDMAECDGEKVVTMMDVLQEQQEFEDDANAVLGASDDKNCTYPKGYVKRQAIYACVTCCPDAATDPAKRAGVCLACSLACHESHELVELYTKRNFRCDCGNPKFTQRCMFTPDKSDLNYENQYNHNFSGIYCVCKRPYPDPEATEEEEMIQCIICEDWLHTTHLDATVPSNELYAEMICKDCMDEYGFLHDYSDLVVNTTDKEIIVMDPDLDFDIKVVPKKATPTKAAKKEIITNGITIAEDKSDKEADGILDSINSIVNEDKNKEEPAEVEKSEEKSAESGGVDNSAKEINNDGQSEDNKEAIDAEPSSAVPKDEAMDNSSDETLDEKVDQSIKDETVKENGSTKELDENTKEIDKSTAEIDGSTKETDENTKEIDASTKELNEDSKEINEDTKEANEDTKEVNEDTKEADENTEGIDGSTKVNTVVEKPSEETDDNKEKAEPESFKMETTSDDATLSDLKDFQNPDIEEKDNMGSSDKENEIEPKAENKRKHSECEEEDSSPKKAKIVEPCLRPKGVKKVYKGATFWPSNLRQKLCSCGECISMYKDLAVLYLIDPDDTVTAYEALGKDNAEGPSSQYEKGLQALQSLDRVQQINALTEYNKMRDKLLEFLKSFKDRKEIVKEEDIKAFFAGMKPKREPDGVYFCR